jgi:hypothetical protein
MFRGKWLPMAVWTVLVAGSVALLAVGVLSQFKEALAISRTSSTGTTSGEVVVPKSIKGKSRNGDDHETVMGAAEWQQHEVPFLEALPNKPETLPSSFNQIKRWMMAPGNETAAQFLLDFAILGHAKCATSNMMRWLNNHQPEIQGAQGEISLKRHGAALTLMEHFYGQFPHLDPNSIKGFKTSNGIENVQAIKMLGTHFPKTKLIIGIRHPVLRMESFYNYRLREGFDMPPFEDLDSKKHGNQHSVSASSENYHAFLKNLGKTALTSREELTLMPRDVRRDIVQQLKRRREMNQTGPLFPRAPNPVFLYDVSQLEDDNPTRQDRFARDLSNFLGLSWEEHPLWPLPSPEVSHKPVSAEVQAKMVHICDDRWLKQRQRLLEIGGQVSNWILRFLIAENGTSDVYVSNPQHFQEVIQAYSRDPCPPQDGGGKNATR